MVASKQHLIFTDIKVSDAIYRWQLGSRKARPFTDGGFHWGGKIYLQLEPDKTFTDDSTGDFEKIQDQTFTDDRNEDTQPDVNGRMGKNSTFTDIER